MLLPSASATRLTAAALRQELNARAKGRARLYEQRHDLTPGRAASVLFGEDDRGLHGNFHPDSYQEIQQHPHWARRLRKAHTACRRAQPRADWPWRELDCACSSDALLMNIFCHPETMRRSRVCALLGVPFGAEPAFGVRPRVPLAGGRADRTEVDLQLGSLLVEAKLTESDFQVARPELVERFRDFQDVFAIDQLPRTDALVIAQEWDEGQGCMQPLFRGRSGHFVSYQLIRGTLAAHATGGSFCVLCDARRPELAERWRTVVAAVRIVALRPRLQLLTWQELAGVLGPELQRFLIDKYGIEPA